MSTTSQQHAPARTSPIALTSNEINILIHCYLLESGLTHSAYTFHLEAKIAQVNPPELLGASVPRGELIRYLHKALLWTEIESHMTESGPSPPCSSPFTLLTPHHCIPIVDSPPPSPPPTTVTSLKDAIPPKAREELFPAPTPAPPAPRPPPPTSTSTSAAPATPSAPLPSPPPAASSSASAAPTAVVPEKRKLEEPASAEERTSGSSSSAGGPPAKESSGKRSRMDKDKDRYKDRDKVAEGEKEDGGGDSKPESSKSSKSKSSIKLAPLPSIPRKSNNTNATRSSGPPSPKASTSKPSSPNVTPVTLPSGSSRSSSSKDKAKSKSKSPPAPLQQQQREQQQQRQTTPAAPFPPPPPTADENWTGAIARSHVPRFREESVGTFEGHTGEVCLATWNPEQLGSLATGGGDATLRLWDFSHPSLSSSSHSGQRRLGSSSGGGGSGWKLDAPPVVCKHLPATTDRKYLTSIDFSPTATLIGTTSYDGIARLWTSEGELHGVLTRHAGTVFKIKFNPRGDVIATCGSDGSVCLWDALSAKLKQAYEFHSDTAVDLDWMDNDILASASMDKTIQIQRVGRSTPVCTFRGHTDEVNRVLWQPRLPNATGPRLLASCSDDANVRVWSLEDGGGADAGGGEFERKGQLEKYCRGVLKGHEKEVYTMAFGPPNPSTGKSTLATGSFDHTIRLWDLTTVSCTHVLRAHTDSVFSLSFSPSGRHLASAGWDKLLVLWDLLAADNSDASSSSGIVSKVGGKRAKPVRQCTTRGSIFEVEWSRFGGALAVAMDNREVLVVDVGEFE